MSVKFTEGLYVITMKNYATFEKELAFYFKIDTTIWRFSTRAFEYLKNCTLMDSFWPKFEVKKYRRIMFDGTEGWRKIWRKLTCAFQYDMRNWTNIHRLKAIILSSDFILQSKMAQLNQIKNSKQLDRQDAVRKLYFAFEIKE